MTDLTTGKSYSLPQENLENQLQLAMLEDPEPKLPWSIPGCECALQIRLKLSDWVKLGGFQFNVVNIASCMVDREWDINGMQ